MMLILIADDDMQVGLLEETPTDLLVSLGDLWDGTIEKAMLRYSPEKVFAVRGNHDSNAPFAPFVTPLHGVVAEHGGLRFGGFGGCWRYKPRGHHLYDQEEVSAVLDAFPAVDVFIAHNSPRGIHERDDEVHQGFDAFLRYIERVKPAYFIHGHQHVNAFTRCGDTTVIGVFGERLLEIP
ncbi:metallophosphoesterase [Luteolibacter sp. Populi]|uniref:metallophosphoesterase family protein n=1 Tax=Luteolibacter sp. Populi TaxID=3230487 RepID=UPI0034653A4D